MEDGMKALALVDAPDHVCCRYRIQAFQPALEAAGWSLTVEGLGSGAWERMRQLRRAALFDAVVLQRKLLPSWQVGLLRRQARWLIFDFDDAVLYRDSYDPRGPLSRRRQERFARTVRAADVVLAGNSFLAECARKALRSRTRVRARAVSSRPAKIQDAALTTDQFQDRQVQSGLKIRVVPTCVDPAKYEVEVRAERSSFDLVWIGSSSTLQGLERERPLLERIASEVPGVRLRLICDRFAGFGPLTVVPIPWSEATEPRDLAEGDVGISMVPDDLWSRGKCGLKVLQYEAACLPVVASRVGVHPTMVRDGWNGFLAGTPAEWVACIRTLARDPGLRERLGRQARADVAVRYGVARWSPAFVAAVAGARDQSQAA
jgi:glycosyltransferase involved in cell wall biosynthesis